MATDTNSMLVNTFSKGMDTDTSDILISNESYRLAKNLRYITDVDETSGELRLIEGASFITDMAACVEEANQSDELTNWKILAYKNVGDIGAIIFERDDDKSWAVFRINYIPGSLADIRVKRIFGWCQEPLSSNKISILLKYENNDNIQLYIADGSHKLMKINLFDKSNPPKENISYILNNSEIIEYAPKLNSILSDGRLMSGLVQYAYRLYNDNNIVTKISPLSELFYVRDTYKQIGSIGLGNQVYSKMGISVKIALLDTEQTQLFPKMQVYRIHYQVNGQQPTILLIYDQEYQLTEQNNLRYTIIEDHGLYEIQNLTTEEFNSLSGVDIIPSVIEQKDHYLFAGNIKYPIVKLSDTYLNMDFRAFSTGDNIGSTIPDNVVNSNLDLSLEYNVNDWLDYNDQSEIGGSGENIKWRLSANPSPEDDAQNESWQQYIRIDESLNDYPQSRFADPEDMRVEKYRSSINVKRGLRHDEVYRYGIILYSRTGIQYPVKWIADIRTPKLDYTINGTELTKLQHVTANTEVMNLLHPVFTITHDFSQDDEDDVIVGYEIVRAVKKLYDTATVSQGIIASTMRSNDDGVIDICSSGMPFIDKMDVYRTYTLTGGLVTARESYSFINVLLFYSPESSYFTNDLKQLILSGEQYLLNVICPLEAKVNSSINPHTSARISDAFITNCYCNEEGGYTPSIEYTPQIGSGMVREKKYNVTFPGAYCATHRGNVDYFNYNDNTYNLYKFVPATTPSEINNLFGPTQSNYYTPTVNFDIKDSGEVYPTDWDKVIITDDFKGFEKQTKIGSYEFYSIVAPQIICDNTSDFNTNKLKDDYSGENNFYRGGLIATCCPSFVLALDSDEINSKSSIVKYYYQDRDTLAKYGENTRNRTKLNNGTVLYTDEWSMLCNIRKPVVPYGGYTKESRDTSTYSHDGYYYPASYNQDIHMFNGDVVVRMFEFTTAHKWYAASYNNIPKCAIIAQVAVETSIDTDLDYGLRFSNITSTNNMTLLQVNPGNVYNKYILDKYAYSYNTAYSSTAQSLITIETKDSSKKENNSFPQRVHYSNQSEMNLALDPWLVFLPLNYLDVEGSYGEITNLRRFKNSLVFWLNRAAGVLSVNERMQIVDKSNLPLILGTGGVLERYDYITTVNGMKENQHADAQSDNVLYWWDYDNAEICAYSGGLQHVQLSKQKYVQNLLNRSKKNSKLLDSSGRSNYPHLEYDNKYNEVLFMIGMLEGGNKVDTLVYNERQQYFTSIYDIYFSTFFQFSDAIIITNYMNNIDICLWNCCTNGDYGDESYDLEQDLLLPSIKYIINQDKTKVKVYDNSEFGGTIPDSDSVPIRSSLRASTLPNTINFVFKTMTNTSKLLEARINGTEITNRQFDFKFAIPRCGYLDQNNNWVTKEYGDRLRGKTMQCELSSTSNSLNFSLQYIITKYRISWS